MILSEQRGKCAMVSDTAVINVSLNRARRHACLIYLFGPAATTDVRISVTALSTPVMSRRRSMTVRGAMIRSASTIPHDGGRCGGSCWSAICFVSRVAMKSAPMLTTSYRHASAARCGHSITYRGSVPVVIRERHGERVAPEGCRSSFPLTRPRRSVGGARVKSRRF